MGNPGGTKSWQPLKKLGEGERKIIIVTRACVCRSTQRGNLGWFSKGWKLGNWSRDSMPYNNVAGVQWYIRTCNLLFPPSNLIVNSSTVDCYLLEWSGGLRGNEAEDSKCICHQGALLGKTVLVPAYFPMSSIKFDILFAIVHFYTCLLNKQSNTNYSDHMRYIWGTFQFHICLSFW